MQSWYHSSILIPVLSLYLPYIFTHWYILIHSPFITILFRHSNSFWNVICSVIPVLEADWYICLIHDGRHLTFSCFILVCYLLPFIHSMMGSAMPFCDCYIVIYSKFSFIQVFWWSPILRCIAYWCSNIFHCCSFILIHSIPFDMTRVPVHSIVADSFHSSPDDTISSVPLTLFLCVSPFMEHDFSLFTIYSVLMHFSWCDHFSSHRYISLDFMPNSLGI